MKRCKLLTLVPAFALTASTATAGGTNALSVTAGADVRLRYRRDRPPAQRQARRSG